MRHVKFKESVGAIVQVGRASNLPSLDVTSAFAVDEVKINKDTGERILVLIDPDTNQANIQVREEDTVTI